MSSETNYRLTLKQVRILTERSIEIHWEDDWEGTLKILNNFGVDILIYDLPWFMEKVFPQEQQRVWKESDEAWHKEHEAKKGKNSGYSSVKTPVIGNKYHLTWAHRGCVWVLKEVLPNGKCKLMTPKTKKIMTANTADLLNLRGV